MKITNLGNGKIAIETPYNPEFVKRIKKTGGRWNGRNKTWETDERNLDVVRSIMRDVYGQDDLPQELINIRVTLKESVDELRGPIVMFGRTIASAFGRDSGAKIGSGVCFEAGGCDSAGSVKNWYTKISSGSVITIHDVPRRAVEEKLGWNDDYGTFEIVEATDLLASLKAEKEALLKRIAEIDEILEAR
jgi:hypothetical protein